MKRVSILTILLFTVTLIGITTSCEAPDSASDTPNNGCGATETCEMEPVNWEGAVGGPPSGPYKVSIELDSTLPTHTIYRPVGVEGKMPIVSWANGGCLKMGLFFAEFLTEIASHGFLVISDGIPGGGGGSEGSMTNPTGTTQIAAIDWAIKQNQRTCSPLYRTVDTTKIAVMGQSCGGLMTYRAAADSRVTTAVIWNSGLFERNQEIYDALHAPMAIFNGGESDVAFPQGEADFDAITKVSIFYANLEFGDLGSKGHGGTYWDDNGGEFARVGIAWLKYMLMEDKGPGGAQMFEGANCGLCNTEWIIEKKNMD